MLQFVSSPMYVFFKKWPKNRKFRKKLVLIITSLIVIIVYFFSLSFPLFDTSYSTVVEGQDGELLAAIIADDGQWRFPKADSVPDKFEKCILYYEDEYFFTHPGFNPVSLFRALGQNISEGKIVSGGSTITMQVIRLARRKNRTILEKIKEMILSTRLELQYSKSEILSLYASHAPFGGNVVGLDAAAWRYYGRHPNMLSWAESAALAVLPNSPSLVFPGKNHEILKTKRDRLLMKLYENEVIDTLTYSLALTEPLPGKPLLLPQSATHLLNKAIKDGKKGERIVTSVDVQVQLQTRSILQKHYEENKHNQINNAGAIVLDVASGEVIAYVGNVEGDENNVYVDVINSPRSTGSILKPFLYAGLLDDGLITPQQLYPDIPTFFEGFTPKNYSLTFDGAVPADEAISRSLNIPAVYMLKDYGHEKFHFLLNEIGLSTINKPPGHYGLSLVLGGAEATLWDLTAAYGGMARTLIHYNQFIEPDRYDKGDFHPNTYYHRPTTLNTRKGKNRNSYLSAQSIWFAFKAMMDVSRPREESSWRLFNSSRKVAWKTGTSFGFRDAWAIGVTPEYVVGIWVGNADGEGRPGLTGLLEAAPILFDVFNILPPTSWFKKPFTGFEEVDICKHSGYRAGVNCPDIVKNEIPVASLKATSCPYCEILHLDPDANYQVTEKCMSPTQMTHKKWFVLPPVQEWYFTSKNPLYKKAPPFLRECLQDNTQNIMEFIYPKNSAKVYVPVQLDGSKGNIIAEVAHSQTKLKLYWHLDDKYIGTTRGKHEMAILPEPGLHLLTIVDEEGNTMSCEFTTINPE